MKEKLTSRKLWGVATVITSALGYIIAEGYIDAKAVEAALEIIEEVEENLNESEGE